MGKSSVMIIGLLVAGSVCGMPNSGAQRTNDNNSANRMTSYVGDVDNRNAEGNEIFLPVTKRRFSEGMINTVIWPAPKRQNLGAISRGNFFVHQQGVRELPSQSNANGLRLDRGYAAVQNNASGPHVGQGYGGLPTPVDANGLCMAQRYTGLSVQDSSDGAAGFVTQEINGSTNENMIFIPTLRNSNSRNQATNSTNLSHQYNNQGYFPQSGVDDDVSKPIFSLLEVLQIAEQQSRVNVEKVRQEMNRKTAELERKNAFLEREAQYHKDRGRHFFPDKIAKLEERVIRQERCIKNQRKKYEEEAGKLEDQLSVFKQENEKMKEKIQYYENGSNSTFLQEIAQLKGQVKELQNQIAEDKSKYEKEAKELEEQLQKERKLNLALSMGTESVYDGGPN